MRIHILAFFLLCQCFVSCQQGQETAMPSAANIVLQSRVAGQQVPEKALSSAANIVFRSADGGQTWQNVGAGLPQDLQVGSIFAGNGEVFLGYKSGLYRGSIAPETPIVYRGSIGPVAPKWEKAYFLDEEITDIFPGRVGPYVRSLRNGFFQEILPGAWEPIHTSLKDQTVRTILETPDGTVFIGCDSGIFKSADGGKAWKQVFADDVVTSLVAADGVLVGGGSTGLLRSTDGGEHWDWVLTGNGSIRKTGRIEGRFVAITNGDGPWKEIITNGIANSLLTSPDSGKTWQRMDERLPAGWFLYDLGKRPVARFINDIEQVGGYLFCSLDSGIFRSSDQGKTWTLVLPSAEGKMFNFAVSGNVIYAVRASLLGGC